MVELRPLHLTDIHDDFEKYEVIANYTASKKDSEQAIDAVMITGDFIEGDHKIEGKMAHLVKEKFEQYYNPTPVQEKQKEITSFVKEHKIK